MTTNALPPISTCPRGQEDYVDFYSDIVRDWRVQYDYRHPNGKLFSCVAKTLNIARVKRDAWIERNSYEAVTP